MKRKFLTFFVILSVIAPSFYLPYQSKKAEAIFGIGDINLESIPQILEYAWEKIGMQIAQKMIDDMVRSTVNWAQSGFNGNPAYVTDPEQYFAELADGIAGDFISSSKLSGLCSPFQEQVRLALQWNYTQQSERQFQCTFSEALGNLQAFYTDFNSGGWEAWFVMTQNNANNPYGALLEAQLELDSQIASAAGIAREELSWNQGYLSFKVCTGTEIPDGMGGTACLDENGNNAYKTGTPGQAIKVQLDKALGSGLEKLITANQIDQLISAFASGLLNKYVLGPEGLFAKSSNRTSVASSGSTSRTSAIDIDNDRVPDGYDGDRDGRLETATDLCYHGGRAPSCLLSSTITNSPYFVPVCQAVDSSLLALRDFDSFINLHSDQIQADGENFKNKADAELWASRASEASASVDGVLVAIQNYRAPYFDDMEIGTNRLANYIGRVLDSLAGDGNDLDLAKIGDGGGGLDNLKSYVSDNTAFFQDIQSRFGNCSQPNIVAVSSVTPPQEPESEITEEDLLENNICATPEEAEQFLANNPGDEHRLSEAFPCSAEELAAKNICATPAEVEQFLANNPGDEHRLDEAFPCIQ